MPTPVLVTGGAGFIGRHLVARLLAAGEAVRVLERPGADVSGLPAGADVVRADVRFRDDVARAVRGCREVYHLAANPHLWTLRRGDFARVNHLGAVHVIEEALAAGARRVLHTSTESILTRARQTDAIAEDQAVTESDVVGPYCRSKFRAERFALRLGRAGAPVVVVNPTLPVGPGDRGRSPPTQMMLDFCKFGRPAYVDASLNLIDARDVAEGMVRAVERGVPGRRYLLGAENWSVRGVFDFLADRTGRPRPRWRVPYPVALTVALVDEFLADVWTHRMPAATLTGVRLTRRVMRFDAARSLAELGLTPRPVSESLDEQLAWFRQVGWLGRA